MLNITVNRKYKLKVNTVLDIRDSLVKKYNIVPAFIDLIV